MQPVAPERLSDPTANEGPVLLVGDTGTTSAAAPALGGPEEVIQVPFDALDGALLTQLQPRLVLCPLFTLQFDVIDVLKRLDRLRWQGRVCALSRPLPNPAMVRKEIAAAVPGRPFELLELP